MNNNPMKLMPCTFCGHAEEDHPPVFPEDMEHEGDYNCPCKKCDCKDFGEIGWV